MCGLEASSCTFWASHIPRQFERQKVLLWVFLLESSEMGHGEASVQRNRKGGQQDGLLSSGVVNRCCLPTGVHSVSAVGLWFHFGSSLS